VDGDMTVSSARAAAVAERPVTTDFSRSTAPFVAELISMSLQALPAMYRSDRHEFVQTVRRDPDAPYGLRGEGKNLRYAAIVALGAARLPLAAQQELLVGLSAAELAGVVAERGLDIADPGAAALAAWAACEVGVNSPDALLDRLAREVKAATPIPTVDYSWTLTALLAATKLPAASSTVDSLAEQAAERLLAAQGAQGIFPHLLPRQALGRLRAHVGCFADQVYPIQALSRYYARSGDTRALEAAQRCADRIIELQGSAGQWWWHYDVRTGDVVEGFPVYSVHQHAMAPMALFELADAGGADNSAAIELGLSWLKTHPETTDELLDPATGAIWRKVGRREPRKATRMARSVSTSFSPRLRLGLLDRAFPPGPVDYECRPYELGWLLYAWLGDGIVAAKA
jgi:hypothetical protein